MSQDPHAFDFENVDDGRAPANHPPVTRRGHPDPTGRAWDYDPRHSTIGKKRAEQIDRSWAQAAVKSTDYPDRWVAEQPRTNVLDRAFQTFAQGKRVFETGASRDTDTGKLDYEAVLSPAVLERYAQYLHDHRTMADGTQREMDNWQKGIPQKVYVKSAWRHFVEWWKWWRSGQIADKLIEEAACGILFNVMGWLHEHLKAKADRAAGQAVASGAGTASRS